MSNESLEKLDIKDVFDNAFWKQEILCEKCSWRGNVTDLRTEEGETKGKKIYRLNCPTCNKTLIDLSLSAWKKALAGEVA